MNNINANLLVSARKLRFAIAFLIVFLAINQPQSCIAQENNVAEISLSRTAQLPTPKMSPLPSVQSVQTTLPVYKHYGWASDRFYHRQLLFEESNLERRGVFQRWQNVRSGSRFLGRTLVLPVNVLNGKSSQFVLSGAR